LINAAEAHEVRKGVLSFQDARTAHQATVFAYVSRRIRPIEEAEDIVAQVFLDAFKQWRKLKGSPRNWLLGIARRKVCDALRRRRGTWPIHEGDAQTSGLDGFVEAAELQEAIKIVMQLPDDQRDAFLMQVLEQMSIDEIGQVMNRSGKAVNSLLQRARARIQRTLDSHQKEGV
jgi:RNA polymerase sigma factor (sigma-70 family)